MWLACVSAYGSLPRPGGLPVHGAMTRPAGTLSYMVVGARPDEVSVVKQYVDALNRRDLKAARENLHPDAQIIPAPAPLYTPPGRTYHGHAGDEGLIQEVISRVPNMRLDLDECRKFGDMILATYKVVEDPGSATGSTRELAGLYRVVDGQIIRFEAFSTESEARAAARRPRLTPREREVFHLLALGLTGREVAEQLLISHDTVRTHVRNVIVKLGAKTRGQAIAIALTRGEIAV